MKQIRMLILVITIFILIVLHPSCQERQGDFEKVFPRGKEVLIKKGYHDVILTGSWPANDQNLNARTNFQAKDKDNNIVEGYFIEVNGKISTYIEKKDIIL